MEKAVSVIDLTDGHATVETAGLYRVVYHNIKSKRVRKIYPDKEFLTAEEAVQIAGMHNNFALYRHGSKALKRDVWAEAVSYSETEERWERERQRADQHERDARVRTAERERWEKQTHKLRKRLKRLKAAN